MKAKSIHEMDRFTRGGDPYSKLGVGMEASIDKALEGVDLEYEVDEDYNLTVTDEVFREEEFIALQNMNPYVKSITITGDLDIRPQAVGRLANYILPSRLTKVEGKIRMFGCLGVVKLPDGLKVGDNLDLSDSGITRLPKNLDVGRDLYINDTNVTRLPSGLKCHNLDWSNTPLSKSYPEKTKYFENKYRKMFWDKGIKIFGKIILWKIIL